MTQDNPGKKTPDVDGVAQLTPHERLDLVEPLHRQGQASPVRRRSVPGGCRPWPIAPRQRWSNTDWSPPGKRRRHQTAPAFARDESLEAIGALAVQLNQQPHWVLAADSATGGDRLNHEAV